MNAWVRAAPLRVLFRAPAGPRRGFGHLVRCRSLARALGVRPVVAVRGGASALAAARRLGCDVVGGPARAVLMRLAPHVLVVDDPVAADARRWIRSARRAGCRVVTVHDLGLGCRDGDLVVDGSIVRAGRATRGRALQGPRFAILDPAFAAPLSAPRPAGRRVCIALGGGPRAALARGVADAIHAARPDVDIRIAGGFSLPLSGRPHRRATWTGPLDGLAPELSRCDVAVVGGGVSLYEACARGVAAVGVPVVAAQRPTVRGFAARCVTLGQAQTPDAGRIAQDVLRLLAASGDRRGRAARGRRLVDGRGAGRVARAIERLASDVTARPAAWPPAADHRTRRAS